MKNSLICPLYKEDYIYIKGIKKKVCTYYDLDNPGLCKHPDRHTCIIYVRSKGVSNPILEKFIEEFELMFVKDI